MNLLFKILISCLQGAGDKEASATNLWRISEFDFKLGKKSSF